MIGKEKKMSNYTTTISRLIRMGFDFQLDEYPIFDEQYRETLNKAILDNYLTYEIGFETPALFRHYLKAKMNLIMPKYNILFVAQEKLLENPLGNVDMTETVEREVQTEGSSTSQSESKGKNLFQDTPQGDLSATDIDAQRWATNLTQDKNNVSDESNTQGNTVESFTRKMIGANGNKYGIDIYDKLIKNFNSINEQIINELGTLFMGVL